MRLPPALAKALADLGARAAKRGQRCAVVGGGVRDALLGRPVRDLDIVVEGDDAGKNPASAASEVLGAAAAELAAECASAWAAEAETFGRFGTARIHLPGGARLDVASARAESYAQPGALPVVRPAKLEDDLARRDFTVNALAQLVTPAGLGEVLDPYGGAADLKARRLRVLHDDSFRDDPTRLYRGARYAARLKLKPDAHTARLMRDAVRRKAPALVSRERLRQELWRILEEPDPRPALGLCAKWGLSAFFHRRFKAPKGLEKAPDALTRLGLIAFAMGRDGQELLSSLPLPREEGAALSAALKAAAHRRTPAQALPEPAVRLLRAALPRLPRAALGPRLVSGADLIREGLAPGPEFSKILDEAARLQWAGKLTAAAARRWLSSRSGR